MLETLKSVYYHIQHGIGNYSNSSIELIFIHIPKTGGTSFKKSPDFDIRFQILFYSRKSYHKQTFRNHQGAYIKSGKTVLQGHFFGFKDMKNYYPKAKLITWLRHPVDRLISSYNYHLSSNHSDNRAAKALKSEKLTLMEYAYHPETAQLLSIYQKFLGDLLFEDFYFVGLTDHYSTHATKLANMLNWDSPLITHENKSTHHVVASTEEWLALETLLSDDVNIYTSYKSKILEKTGN